MEHQVCYFWDIETSTVEVDNGELMQVTYLSNVLSMDCETGELFDSVFFRDIAGTVEYFKALNELDEKVIVWSHNLDYELSFLLRELGESCGAIRTRKNGQVQIGIYDEEVQDIILRDKHAPLSIRLDILPNITFRDSYALFNKSVKRMGKELGLPKLDYEYKVTRLPWSKLEQHDFNYNARDNVIVAKYLFKYMRDNNFTINDVPLTFTSFVRRKRKDFIKEHFGKNAINKFYFDRNKQYESFDFFNLKLLTYQGGLTASNIRETGKLIEKGTYSIDIKSSYPFQMVDKYFPFYDKKFTYHFKNGLADEFYKHGQYEGFFGMFKFTNIRVKNMGYLLCISGSQLNKGWFNADLKQYNGKLLSCGEITIPCNNVDIDTIKLVYDFDSIECLDIFVTNKSRRLRFEELSFILKSFHDKETITDKEDLEYALAKVVINAMYGIKVTCPIKSSFSIELGEIEEKTYFSYNMDKREEIYERYLDTVNDFSGSTDIFTDGCYITSFARYKLVEMVVKLVDMGCHVIYSDTDSIKFYLEEKGMEHDIIEFINKTNSKIIASNKRNHRFKQFKKEFEISEEGYDKIARLGIWELETVDEEGNPCPLPVFMTYGAKKYGYIDKWEKVHTTIAGCNKTNPPIIIQNLAKRENISIKEAFKFVFACGTMFDCGASGRTTAIQEVRDREEVYNYTYRGKRLNQYGGTIIQDTTYTLNVSINDSKLIDCVRATEYIFKINLEGEVRFG